MAAGVAGFHNPAVHAARLLRHKKHRLERRCFLIEGQSLLEAAVAARARIEQIFRATDAALDPAVERALPAETPTFNVDRRTLASLADTQAPQGVVAVIAFLDRPISDLKKLVPPETPAMVLVLHDLSDPGNAGTLVRSAAAFGAAAVCFGPQAVEPYNDKLVRASMGSLFSVPIVRYQEWHELRASVRALELQLLAAEPGGDDVRMITLPQRSALLVGQERRGLHDVPAQDVDAFIRLPQRQNVDSLNVAVAGSILLFELSRASGLLHSAEDGAPQVKPGTSHA